MFSLWTYRWRGKTPTILHEEKLHWMQPDVKTCTQLQKICGMSLKASTGQSPRQPITKCAVLQLWKRRHNFSEMPEVTQLWLLSCFNSILVISSSPIVCLWLPFLKWIYKLAKCSNRAKRNTHNFLWLLCYEYIVFFCSKLPSLGILKYRKPASVE